MLCCVFYNKPLLRFKWMGPTQTIFALDLKSLVVILVIIEVLPRVELIEHSVSKVKLFAALYRMWRNTPGIIVQRGGLSCNMLWFHNCGQKHTYIFCNLNQMKHVRTHSYNVTDSCSHCEELHWTPASFLHLPHSTVFQGSGHSDVYQQRVISPLSKFAETHGC